MLRSIRDEISSWYMQLILIILVLSFVTFYGWSGSSLGAGNVASVGKDKLSMQDYQFQLQNRLQYFQSQGINITKEQQGFVQNMIISSFVNERILYQEAKSAGFLSSQDQIRTNIKNAFSDEQGNFNFDFYQNYVRNRLGKNPSLFEKEEGQRIMAQAYQDWVMSTNIQTPLGLEHDYLRNNDKRSIAFVEISLPQVQEKLSPGSKISAGDIEQYYQDHTDRFTTMQTRKFDILQFTQDTSNPKTDQDPATQARKSLTLVKNDTTVDYQEYAKTQEHISFQETDWVSYNSPLENISSEDLAMIINSSLSLEVDSPSDILQSRDGSAIYLVKVKGIKQPEVKPLESAQEEILAILEMDQKQQALRTYVENLHTQWQKTDQPLAKIAKKNNLQVQKTESFTFSADGMIPMVGPHIDMAKEVFASGKAKKDYLSKAYLVDNKYYIAQINTVEMPDMKAFTQKKVELWDLSSQDIASNKLSVITEQARQNTKIFQLPLESL